MTCTGIVATNAPITPRPTTTRKPGHHHHTPSPVFKPSWTKIIMELAEPGTRLPQHTRKYVIYFDQQMKYTFDEFSKTISFMPEGGGLYTGTMQIGYLGTGPRGNKSNEFILDAHLGMYSYKPMTSYCVSDDQNKAFVNFDWNPVNGGSYRNDANLMMLALPHHVSFLQLLYGTYYVTL